MKTSPIPTTEESKVATNGSGLRAEALALEPPRSGRSRIPQAVLAGLLIVGGGLGGLLLFSRYNQRVPAVVVTQPIQHGQVIERDDLGIAEVALEGDVVRIASISDVAGRLAAHDLGVGELVGPSDVATEDELLSEGESVIGLLLEPGGYPTRQLAPGDRVDVFAPGPAGGPDAGSSADPLADDLVVFDVVEASSDGRTLLISLVVTSGQADAVFDAADAGGVRLALKGRE